jgi:hypothetical protein
MKWNTFCQWRQDLEQKHGEMLVSRLKDWKRCFNREELLLRCKHLPGYQIYDLYAECEEINLPEYEDFYEELHSQVVDHLVPMQDVIYQLVEAIG